MKGKLLILLTIVILLTALLVCPQSIFGANGDYFTLNKMGTEIFSCISEGMDTEGIIEHLLENYDAGYDRVKKDVVSLIDEMKEKNIIIDN